MSSSNGKNSSPTSKTKKSEIRSSCENCRNAHKACNREGPPCQRCIDYNIQSNCVYRDKSEKKKKTQVKAASSNSSPASSSPVPSILSLPRLRGTNSKAISGEQSPNQSPSNPKHFPRNLNSSPHETISLNHSSNHSSPSASPLTNNMYNNSNNSTPLRKSRPPPKNARRASDWQNQLQASPYMFSDGFYLDSSILFSKHPMKDPINSPLRIVNQDSSEQLIYSVETESEDCFWTQQKPELDSAIFEKARKKLPKSSFRELTEDLIESTPYFHYSPIWEKPNSYVVYQEKSAEELDQMCEYDMDSEDEKWLSQFNESRKKKGLSLLSEDEFEIMIDRLEKTSFEQENSQSVPFEEDIDVDNTNCCICNDGTSDDTNQIVFCDGCDIGVHQECYGIRYIPEGLWFCQKCEAKLDKVSCIFCPKIEGAFKRTTDGRWAHVICALWIPEINFTLTEYGMRGLVDQAEKIPRDRWRLVCELCQERRGACIQCRENTCCASFHVTCAQEYGLSMQVKEKTDSFVYLAACLKHSPKKRGRPFKKNELGKVEEDNEYDQYESEIEDDEEFENDFLPRSQRNNELHKKKFLEVFSHATISLAEAEKALKSTFDEIPKIWEYWTEKRKSRSGNPLLKRFHKSILIGPRGIQKKGSSASLKEQQETLEKLKLLKIDLERCRLILDLIKKRELTKKQILLFQHEIMHLQTNPQQLILTLVLKRLEQENVSPYFFSEPSSTQYPDYYDKIKSPMSLTTMRQKLEASKYKTEQEFWQDFALLCNNAISYFPSTSVIYKEAKHFLQLGQEEQERSQSFDFSFLESQFRLGDKIELRSDDEITPLLSNNNNTNSILSSPRNSLLLSDPLNQKKPLPYDSIFDSKFDSIVAKKKGIIGNELTKVLTGLLQAFRRIDKYEIFKDLVDPSQVPDYYDIIKRPVAFSTMEENINSGKYKSLKDFVNDFRQLIKNALIYNAPTSIFFKEAKNLEWMGYKLIVKIGREKPLAESIVCIVCAQTDNENKLIICDGCDTGYHIYCVQPPLKRVPKIEWFCVQCDPSKFCNICKGEEDDSSILLCDGCNRGYHLYCLDPPLESIPRGTWLCMGCDPIVTCSLCGKENHESKMILCSSCQRPVHQTCIPKESSYSDNSKGWLCSFCNFGESEVEEDFLESEEDETDTINHMSISPIQFIARSSPSVSNHINHKKEASSKKESPTQKLKKNKNKEKEKKIRRGGACQNHRRAKKRCPEDCPGRIALAQKNKSLTELSLSPSNWSKRRKRSHGDSFGDEEEDDERRLLAPLSRRRKLLDD